ncbi:MAG: hypothetical protein ABIE74_02065, partial [Pseudomonadota bacterium]
MTADKASQTEEDVMGNDNSHRLSVGGNLGNEIGNSNFELNYRHFWRVKPNFKIGFGFAAGLSPFRSTEDVDSTGIKKIESDYEKTGITTFFGEKDGYFSLTSKLSLKWSLLKGSWGGVHFGFGGIVGYFSRWGHFLVYKPGDYSVVRPGQAEKIDLFKPFENGYLVQGVRAGGYLFLEYLFPTRSRIGFSIILNMAFQGDMPIQKEYPEGFHAL